MTNYSISNFNITPIREYVDKHIDKWKTLYNTSNLTPPFYHPLFLQGSKTNYSDSSFIIYYGNEEGHHFGFLANFLRQGHSKICQITVPKNFAADHLAFLDNSPKFELAKYFFLHLHQITGCHLIQGEYVSKEFVDVIPNLHFFKLFIGVKIKCPRLYLKKINPDIISSLSSKKFRANLRQSEKKTLEAGLQFKYSTNSSDFSYLFGKLIELHGARTSYTHKESLFLNEAAINFHKSIITESANYSNAVKFYFYEIENEIVGIIYGFLIGNVFYFFQSGIHPKFEKYSIGNLILLNAIRKLKSEKIEVFDFMRGADKYKFKWTNDFSNNYIMIAALNFKGLCAFFRLKLRYFARKNGRTKGLIQALIN